MWNVTALLCTLIGAAAPLSFFDGASTIGIVGTSASLCLVVAIFALRPGELAFVKSTVAPPLIAGLVLPLLIVVQMLPVPWWAHPVWKSAAEALGYPLSGSVSIDTGASLGALITYLAGLNASIAAAAVAVDPRRANALANAVMATSAVAALLAVAQHVGIATWLDHSAPIIKGQSSGLVAVVLIGIPVSVASALETRDASGSALHWQRRWLLILAAVLGTTSAAWSVGRGGAIPIAAGVALVVAIWTARRLRIPVWSSLVVAVAIAGIGAATAIALRHPDVPFAISFSQAPQGAIETTQSLLADIPPLGAGAGTIEALIPTYTDWQEPASAPVIASAASVVTAEFGAVASWAILVVVAIGIYLLVAGALRRGKDWSFAAAAAAVLLTLVLAAFTLPTVLSPPAIAVLGAVVGSAVSQRVSRTRLKAG